MTEMVKVDAYASATLEERRQYVAAIAQAGDLLPKSLWSQVTRNPDGSMNAPAPSPAKVLLLAETGSMLGLHPMAALQSIHIIDGKPTLSANLLAALVRRAGHRLRVTTKGSWAQGTFVARAVLIRADDPDFEFVVEWDVDRAKRAGLVGKKGPWMQYPEAMSKARAITEVIREGAPDVTIVAAYTPEELGASNVTEDGEVVDMTPSAPAPTPSAPAAEAPKAPEAPAPDPAAVAAWQEWKEAIDAAPDKKALTVLWQQAGTLLANKVPDGSGLTVQDYFSQVAATLPEDAEVPQAVPAEAAEAAEPEVTADPATGEVTDDASMVWATKGGEQA